MHYMSCELTVYVKMHYKQFSEHVVVTKLMYRSSACWGFASVTDRQKLKAFIRRSIRAGFYTPDPDYDFEQLRNEADHRLFNTV